MSDPDLAFLPQGFRTDYMPRRLPRTTRKHTHPSETMTDEKQHSTVSVWLYEQLGIRIEGKIRVRTSRRELASLMWIADFSETGL